MTADEVLSSLVREVAGLKAQVERLADDREARAIPLAPQVGHGAPDGADRASSYAVACWSPLSKARPPLPDPKLLTRILRHRRLRDRYFEPQLFADPAWDILLELTAARAEHRQLSVTSLCYAAAVPMTTALRWTTEMTRRGLLIRHEYWATADDRLMRDVTINKALSAPVNFIVHDLADVNDQLSHGRPFFVDIAAQGIALYEAEGFELATPRVLPPEEARAEARRHFERWFESAGDFLEQAKLAASNGRANVAAFELHQAAERLYHCVSLVLTLYSPKSHKLNFLRSHAEDVAPELINAWPRADKVHRRAFELLREAYVNARYSPHYTISDEQLKWLAQRIGILQQLVRGVCERRLA